MSDFFPPVARGVRSENGVPAPPRPDEDERWEYVADHLRAIRASLGLLAFVAALQVAALMVALVIWMTNDSGGSGF